MTNVKHFSFTAFAALLSAGVAIVPVASLAKSKAVTQRETAVAPETNPPGDIPDNQVFITYKSPKGYSMQVPEGWARSNTANGVSFTDKYGGVDIASSKAAKAPTDASVKQNELADLKANGHAVDVKKIRMMKLPVGKTVAVDYLSNSAVNPVTDRKIRLENRRLFYFHNGQEVSLTLSAPAGADNVDAWKMMAESFQWAS